MKVERSCRPSSDSTAGAVLVRRTRADLDAAAGIERHERRRASPIMGRTPFLFQHRSILRSLVPKHSRARCGGQLRCMSNPAAPVASLPFPKSRVLVYYRIAAFPE